MVNPKIYSTLLFITNTPIPRACRLAIVPLNIPASGVKGVGKRTETLRISDLSCSESLECSRLSLTESRDS